MASRTPARKTARRWSTPPPLVQGAESLECGRVLDEVPAGLGALLWQALRDVMLWAQAPRQQRARLHAPGAAAQRRGALERTDGVEALRGPLGVLCDLLGPADVGEAAVADACAAVAAWAERGGRTGTARAETWFRRAVVLAREAGDWASYARAFAGLGNLYLQRGVLGGGTGCARSRRGRCTISSWSRRPRCAPTAPGTPGSPRSRTTWPTGGWSGGTSSGRCRSSGRCSRTSPARTRRCGWWRGSPARRPPRGNARSSPPPASRRRRCWLSRRPRRERRRRCWTSRAAARSQAKVRLEAESVLALTSQRLPAHRHRAEAVGGGGEALAAKLVESLDAATASRAAPTPASR